MTGRGQVGDRGGLAHPELSLRGGDDLLRGSQLGHLQAEVLVGRLLGLDLRREAVQGELALGQDDVEIDQPEGHHEQPDRLPPGPGPGAGAGAGPAVLPDRDDPEVARFLGTLELRMAVTRATGALDGGHAHGSGRGRGPAP